MDYTWLDFIIFGFIFFNAILGISRGLTKEIISILVLIVALVVMIKFTATLANFLNTTQGSLDVITVISKFTGLDATVPLALISWGIALLLLFVGTFSIGEAVNFYASIDIIPFSLDMAGRILGGVLGFVRGYVFSLILILVLGLSPIILQDAWRQSFLIPKLLPNATDLGKQISPGGFPVWSGMGTTS